MMKSLAPIYFLGQLLFVAASAGSLSQGVHKVVEAMLAEDNSFHVYSACTKTYDDVHTRSVLLKGTIEWNRSMMKNLMGDVIQTTASLTAMNLTRLKIELSNLAPDNGGDSTIRDLTASMYVEDCGTPLGNAHTFPATGHEIPMEPSAEGVVATKIFDTLVDFEDVGSVRTRYKEVDMCCSLIPTLPLVPEMYSAVIEANFERGEGESYTMLRKEYYMPDTGRERLEEHVGDKSTITIKDFSAGKKWTLTHRESDSESDPEANLGVCTEYDMTGSNEFRYETIGAHLQSVTARMSFSHQSAREVFFGEGNQPDKETYHGNDFLVRGVKSEKWSHTFLLPDYSDPNVYTPGNSNYTLSHFFPVEDWRNAGWHTHRNLKRVLLEGQHSDGKKVKHTYEYIDMVPYIYDPDRVFNPCIVLDGQFGGNCTCSARLLSVLITDLSGLPLHKANHHYTMDDLCDIYGVSPKEAAGAIAAAAIICWISGVGMGIAMWYCRSKGAARRQQRHMQFTNGVYADTEMATNPSSNNAASKLEENRS
mmetsp:Transcript_28543/g.47949  ORF Transcript_28543/g.47949 Transcript_28543/m.47949 type:complete len:535 (+) Transcript_28543:106-1710(+)